MLLRHTDGLFISGKRRSAFLLGSMKGVFISFEGTEGGGKSTQIQRLAERLRKDGFIVRTLREPGGTPIGEEIRHTLKHSAQNHAMTPEAELLLVNASRAQLVHEVIRPALKEGEVILCDRFFDSTIAYQAYGRQLDIALVRQVIDVAIADTRPDLTLLLSVPVEVSESRRLARKVSGPAQRDRFEDQSDQSFFLRVEEGYRAIAAAEPDRIKVIDATPSIEKVEQTIWHSVQPIVDKLNR